MDLSESKALRSLETWELIARECIRNTIASYNANGDHCRTVDLAACFTEDGILERPSRGAPVVGRANIENLFTRLIEQGSLQPPGFVHHHVASVAILSLSPSAATVRSYFQVMTDHGLDHWGRYVDRLVPVDGDWLFARRRGYIDGRVDGSWIEVAATCIT
jgi:hypothetical protein